MSAGLLASIFGFTAGLVIIISARLWAIEIQLKRIADSIDGAVQMTVELGGATGEQP